MISIRSWLNKTSNPSPYCVPHACSQDSFGVLVAALAHLQHGLLQVTDDGWYDQMIHVPYQLFWEAKYFCAVAVNCRPSYLNFLLRLRQSRPDEPLKHRNIGEISQQSSQILQFFILKWNMKDDMVNANIDVFISGSKNNILFSLNRFSIQRWILIQFCTLLNRFIVQGWIFIQPFHL